MPEVIAYSRWARLGARTRKLRPALVPAAAIILALIPACVGLTWGLPSEERFARVTGERRAEAVRAIIRRTNEDAPRKAAGLAIVPLDISRPDTPGRMWRRFALYSDHPDEMLVFFALSRMRPGELGLDPGAYHYGGLFIYPLGATIRLAGWLGLATVTRDLGVYLERPERFGRFYVIGRLYVLAWHAAGLLALWLLAREIVSRRGAYLAVALYALLPATVCFSHVMKPHLPGAALVVFAALALRKLEGTRGVVTAGALLGAAASMTPVHAMAIFLLPAALWARGELASGRSWKALLAGAAAAAAVYAVLNPYAVLQPGRVLEEMGHSAGVHSIRPSLLAPVMFVRFLPDALTWPGLFAAAASVAWLVVKRPRDARAFGVPLAVYFVAVSIATARSSVGPANARFGCALYPFLALFAAGAVEGLTSRGGRAGVAGVALALVLLVSLVLGSAPYVAAFAESARGGGTRERAGRLIESRVPAGSTVGTRGRLAPFRTPALELGRYALLDAHFDPDARADWFLTADRERPPEGYSPAARAAPFGVPGFGSPERMSFVSPVFTLWVRERRSNRR